MSAGEEQAAEPEAVEAGPGEMSEWTAKAIVVVVGCGAMWGVVAAFPWVAYVVVGVLGTLGWQKARGWIGRRRSDEADEPDPKADETAAGDAETWRVPTFHELCESLARVGTPHAHIAVLAHDLGTTPERVREALDACGVQVEAVRMQGRGSSTGVKGDALPVPRPPLGGVVAAGQPADNDNNNAEGDVPREGLRVEPIGLSGTVTYHPADAVRHHRTE